MRPHWLLILFAVTQLAGHGYVASTEPAEMWTAETSCKAMTFDQLAGYFDPGQSIVTAGSFTLRARTRDSCTQYQGCSPWLDPAPARMEADAIHALPTTGQITLYAGASSIAMTLSNREPGIRDHEIRMQFAEFAPGQVIDHLGDRAGFEIELLDQPLGGSPPRYRGSALDWEGSLAGSTHFTGRLCADGSFHLVSALPDGLGLAQYAVYGRLSR